MTNNNQIGENKEQTIFDHKGNAIMTEDREIQIISKFRRTSYCRVRKCIK